MKLKIYSVLLFFVLSLNFNLANAGGIENDGDAMDEVLTTQSTDESSDDNNVELTTRENISEFQELQEPLYEKLEEIIADGCNGEGNIVKWSGGCVTWSGGYIQEGEVPDIYVRYGL